MKDKVLAYGFVGLAAVLLVLAVYRTVISPETGNKKTGITTQGVPGNDTVKVPPTLSPQERDIIAKIETLSVEITDTAVTPPSIVVKQYDQVQFFNRSAKSVIRIDGTTWGKVPLNPGENMTQAFREVGTFAYTIMGTTLKGEVTVR